MEQLDQRGIMSINRIVPVALIAGAGLTLAACSSDSTAHVATPALKASQSASVPAGWGRVASATFTQTEWNVLNNLPSTGPTSGDWSNIPMNVSAGLANGVCSDLQAGDTTSQVNADTNQVVASGYFHLTKADLQTLVTVATTYCGPSQAGASAPTATVDPTPWVNALNTVGTDYTQFPQDAEGGAPGSYEADYTQFGTDIKALHSLGPVPGQPTSVNADLTLAYQEYAVAGSCILGGNDDDDDVIKLRRPLAVRSKTSLPQ